MHRLPVFVAFAITAASVAAAGLPQVPAEPIAIKKDLLFSDDFSAATPAAAWHKVVPTFTFEEGALKGVQTREKDVVSADGKSTNKAHAAVHGLAIPTRDSVVECRIKFDGATMIDVEFDDRAYTNSHYGHLCRAVVRTNGVTIMDEREGSQNMAIKALRNDPTKKDEVTRLMSGRQITYPMSVTPGVWHDLIVETAGETMRVVLDGKPAALLKSPGIGHATKSKIELGTAGKGGWFDDIKVWNAEPVSP